MTRSPTLYTMFTVASVNLGDLNISIVSAIITLKLYVLSSQVSLATLAVGVVVNVKERNSRAI